jgi:DNA-binding transcriptional regulator WhiA
MNVDFKIAELIGVILGDGNLWSNGRWYEITITGHPIKDKKYFQYLSNIFQNMGLYTYIRVRGGLRLTIKSKKFFDFLTKDLGIFSGKLRSKSKIPKEIIKSKKFSFCFIRGFFDTDGSIFISKKPGINMYPSLELNNNNKDLMFQIHNILLKNGYRSTIRSYKNEFKIGLHGLNMIKKWNKEIGSSNPHKQKIFDCILSHR